tara:strand:+ start:17553 stop:18680 length:1128 start_codon:yes stop_codon:yes gene_type:complete
LQDERFQAAFTSASLTFSVSKIMPKMAQSGMSRMSARAKSRLYSNLEKYARSGMGMEKACSSLLEQPRLNPAERLVYEAIRGGLSRGESIGTAMGGAVEVVTALEVEIVSASEEGGMLEKGFTHLAEYFRRTDQTHRRIIRGLTYPLILVHVAIPVCTFVAAMVQQVSAFWGGDGGSSPFKAAFSEMAVAMLVVYLSIAILVVLGMLLHQLARRNGAVDAVLSRVPLIGAARKSVAMERFSQVFEIFLLAGKKMSDCLAVAGKASGSGLIYEASLSGERIVADGDLLASALYAAPGAFSNEFVRGMAAAEEVGALDNELERWGRFYSEEAARASEQLGNWTPKLFYWGILIVVAWMIIRSGIAYKELILRLLEGS